MKCYACNYEHDGEKKATNPWDTQQCIEEGTARFIHIRTNASIEVPANYGGTMLSEVSLYACPNCGTVRMEKW